jgi:hypothetical protein
MNCFPLNLLNPLNRSSSLESVWQPGWSEAQPR